VARDRLRRRLPAVNESLAGRPDAARVDVLAIPEPYVSPGQCISQLASAQHGRLGKSKRYPIRCAPLGVRDVICDTDGVPPLRKLRRPHFCAFLVELPNPAPSAIAADPSFAPGGGPS